MAVDNLPANHIAPADCGESGIIPVLDEVSREVDHERLDPWLSAGAPAAAGTISEFALGSGREAVIELRSCIPVHNVACMRALARRGAAGAWLSPELTLAEIERIAPHRGDLVLGLMVLGAPRVMTSGHCILQVAGACIHDCANCRLRTLDFKLKNIGPPAARAHGAQRAQPPVRQRADRRNTADSRASGCGDHALPGRRHDPGRRWARSPRHACEASARRRPRGTYPRQAHARIGLRLSFPGRRVSFLSANRAKR